jgi:glycosyltransferase involved in cell wall biosynthesis
LINSLSTFLLENHNVQLRIIGKKEDNKYYSKINEIVNKKNLQKRVIFLGEIGQEEIAKYMNSSKILLMASSSEGLPRVLIEAGFCGLPSIASNIDGIHDPFSLKGGTLVYELNSKKEFLKNVNSLFNNEVLWMELSQQSLKLSEEIAGKGSFAQNWENLINMIELNE